MIRNWFALFALLLTSALVAEQQILPLSGTYSSEWIDIRWDVDMPVQLDGWTAETLPALQQKVGSIAWAMRGYTDNPNPPTDFDSFVKRITDSTYAGTPLDVATRVKIAFATPKWVGIVQDGYDNEGGCGCHTTGDFYVLSVPELQRMKPEWFITDLPAAHRMILEKLKVIHDLEDSWVEEAIKADFPDFFPVPNGIRFRYDPYTIQAGCFGMMETTLSWKKLASVTDAARLAELQTCVLGVPATPQTVTHPTPDQE